MDALNRSILAIVGSVLMWQLAAGAQPAARQRPAPTPAPDPKGSHVEAPQLETRFGRLTAVRISPDGALVACDGKARQIRVFGEDGRVARSIAVPFAPEALAYGPGGVLFCGGGGKLAKLDAAGEILKVVDMPSNVAIDVPRRRRGRSRPNMVSGMAVSEPYLFATFGSGWSVGAKAKLFRFDLDLGTPTALVEGLRGCCQRCDIAVYDGVIYVAENSAYRIAMYDVDGKLLGRWGAASRTGMEGFGSCCNPMNVCFDRNGVLYTSESGVGRVKRYTRSGEFLGLVGYVGVDRFTRASAHAAACSNMAIAATAEGDRVYVMDYRPGAIRVLQREADR